MPVRGSPKPLLVAKSPQTLFTRTVPECSASSPTEEACEAPYRRADRARTSGQESLATPLHDISFLSFCFSDFHSRGDKRAVS